MAQYESVFILDSLLAQEEIDKFVTRVKDVIEGDKGKVLNIDRWGKRRLTYEIQKKQYGYYVSVEFESEGSTPRKLESEYNFSDTVLRYLTYRYNKNKLKFMEQQRMKLKEKPASVENSEIKETKSTKETVEVKDGKES